MARPGFWSVLGSLLADRAGGGIGAGRGVDRLLFLPRTSMISAWFPAA